MTELSRGEFLYDAEQELFYVVVQQNNDTVTFAVHGWRTMNVDRVDEYITSDRVSLFHEDDVHEVIEEDGDKKLAEQIAALKKNVFNVYQEREYDEDGPHESFALDETSGE